MSLEHLLQPRSIAIVGASPEAKKIPGMIIDFLRKSGCTAKIYPVNPKYPAIHDYTCYPNIDALPETVDLVVVVIPVAVAFDAIEAAARRGVPFCLLMSGGFGEGRSGATGFARKERLLALCRDTGMQVVGPNTVGMVNFLYRMPLTFADWYGRDTGQRGGVAIVTHSGSVGGLIFSSLQINKIGVNYWIGLGNEASLECADFIAHFSDDPDIHTVICYMEGVQNGRKFLDAANKARRAGKKVVVVKAGDNPESVRSTLSHTGKNPSPHDIYASAFRQSGVIQVASLTELAYVMTLLTTAGERLCKKEKIGVGIISASGGANSLIADHIVNAGLALPELSASLQETLNAVIPEYGSSLNPVDLSADVISRPELLNGTLAAIPSDDSVDVWVVFGRPVVDRYYEALAAFAKSSGKSLVVSCVVPVAPEIHAALQSSGIAVLPDPELCMRALACIQRASAIPAFTAHSATTPASALPEHAGGVPVLLTSIRNDPDFGIVMAISVASPLFNDAHSHPRHIIRVLPATAADWHDALCELAALEGALPATPEAIVPALLAIEAAYDAHPDSAEANTGLNVNVSLCLNAGQLQRCA